MDHFHQHIPRPSDAIRLEATWWTGIPPNPLIRPTTAQVLNAFPVGNAEDVDLEGVRASVLVGIVDRSGTPSLVLTRRALHLDRDPGLIALPGGYVEPEEDPLGAALREAEEEVGLDASEVAVIECLGVFTRSRTGLRVAAYLGVLDRSCQLSASADEVHEIIEVPLAALFRGGTAWQEEWEPNGESRIVHFFADAETLGDNLIWGLTAAIIWRLLDRVAQTINEQAG